MLKGKRGQIRKDFGHCSRYGNLQNEGERDSLQFSFKDPQWTVRMKLCWIVQDLIRALITSGFK